MSKRSKKDIRRKLWLVGTPVTVVFTYRGVYIDGSAVLGAYSSQKYEIWIDARVPREAQVSTLWHEACHASVALTVSQIEIDDLPPSKHEEFLARGIEIGLFTALRDPRNRWFVRLLLGRGGR